MRMVSFFRSIIALMSIAAPYISAPIPSIACSTRTRTSSTTFTSSNASPPLSSLLATVVEAVPSLGHSSTD